MTKTILCIFLSSLLINGVIAKEIPDIKFPSFMKVSEVAGKVNLGKLDVKTYVFRSSKGNKEILAYFNELWDGKVKSVKTSEWIYHSYFDGEFLYSIQLQTKGEGGTFFSSASSYNGIIGISQPGAVTNNSKRINIEKIYPIAPGTKVLTDLSSIDLGNKSRTTVLDSPGSVMSNLIHYKRHFELNEWSEVLNKMSLGMAKQLGGSSLVMTKGVDELAISFIPSDGNRTKIVSVLVEK
ncbi:hypothetical protein [Cocleimonas flava]|jgi:hypothetical protein|nr:hypothetical protein [Cocleimonas flava]